jgi:hypothetical protein
VFGKRRLPVKRICVVCLLIAMASGIALPQPRPPRQGRGRVAEREVELLNRRALQAMANNDVETLDKLLDADWTFSLCFGLTVSKAEMIMRAKAFGPKSIEIATEGVKVRIYGVTAFVSGKVKSPGASSNFTNIYVRRQSGWRAIFSAANVDSLDDPPLRKLDPREIPYGVPPRSPRP